MPGFENFGAFVDILMKHQELCGPLEQSDDGEEITCTVCGAKVIKRENKPIINTEEFTIGIL